MKCRKHPIDQSSAVGVCATCLRERLIALIAAQAQAEALAHAHAHASPFAAAADGDHRPKPDLQPPTHLAFPRSVSPYISRRKSDAAVGPHHHRFYSTPQVGPIYKYSNAEGGFVAASEPPRKKKRGRLSLFVSLLFGKSRSEKFDSESDPRFSSDSFPSLSRLHRDSCRGTPSSSSASSWLSFLNRRGKTPERGEESDDEGRESRSPPPPPGSGYASESSHAGGRRRRKGTPSAAGQVVRAPRTGPHSRNVSGLSFCLSPLVRPSPARQWGHPKCGFQPDGGYSCEIVRVAAAHPHLSTAASYRGNRS